MRRRHDDRRIAVVLEPEDEFERGLLEPRQRQLVIVVFVAVVPGMDTGDAAAETLGQHDDAAAVKLGDVGGPARIAPDRAGGVQHRAVGDADEVGAERARLGLDLGRGQRLLEHRRPCSVTPFLLGRRRGRLGCARCCARLNSCNCRATMPL